MNELAVFYQLTHKFVNNQDKIPDTAQQVVYYSLAIGHHVGVMDCFDSWMEIPLEDYRDWITRLPEGNGRKKLEGLLKWGEIEINSSHTMEILSAFDAGLTKMNEREAEWTNELIRCLMQMRAEPALYLMVRKQT